MARRHGKGGKLYLSPDNATAASPVAYLRDWTLNMPTDTSEVTSTDDENKVYVQGFADLSGSANFFWDDTQDAIYTASRSTDPVYFYLYPDATNADSKYHYGPAWVDFSSNGGVSAPVMIAMNFKAGGSFGSV